MVHANHSILSVFSYSFSLFSLLLLFLILSPLFYFLNAYPSSKVIDVDDSLSYQLVDGFRAPMALKLDPENR